MKRNEQYNQEVKKRNEVYFGYLSDEYMTREVYEWNCRFMSDYYRLEGWVSEDGATRYTPEKIAQELGFDPGFKKTWEFKSCVRRQMVAYKEMRALELHKAGKTNEEIAADLTVGDMEMTEKSVARMLERLLG